MSSGRPGGMGTAPKRPQKERMCSARDCNHDYYLVQTSDDDRECVVGGWIRDVAAAGNESPYGVLTRTFQARKIRREKERSKKRRCASRRACPIFEEYWHGPAEAPSPFRIAAVHRSCPKSVCVFPLVASRIWLTLFWASSSGLSPLFLLLSSLLFLSFRESPISLAGIECNPAACLAPLFRQLLF